MPQDLELEKNPTASKEAEEFANADDRRAKAERDHELAIIRIRQGFIGKMFGSDSANLNLAFYLGTLFSLGAIISLICSVWAPAMFDGVNLFLAAAMTVAGYVFGAKNSKSD